MSKFKEQTDIIMNCIGAKRDNVVFVKFPNNKKEYAYRVSKASGLSKGDYVTINAFHSGITTLKIQRVECMTRHLEHEWEIRRVVSGFKKSALDAREERRDQKRSEIESKLSSASVEKAINSIRKQLDDPNLFMDILGE